MIDSFILKYLQTIGSTQDWIRDSILDGSCVHGLVAYTYNQVSGYGQYGRKWIGIEGNLALTIATKLKLNHTNETKILTNLPLVAAVGVGSAIEEVAREIEEEKADGPYSRASRTSLGIQYKWINDVLLRGRKVAGILCQTLDYGADRWMMIGIGINVIDTPPHLASHSLRLDTTKSHSTQGSESSKERLQSSTESIGATSLKDHGIILANEVLIHSLLDNIKKYYNLWINEQYKIIEEIWNSSMYNPN